jgi:hypothetical protein
MVQIQAFLVTTFSFKAAQSNRRSVFTPLSFTHTEYLLTNIQDGLRQGSYLPTPTTCKATSTVPSLCGSTQLH